MPTILERYGTVLRCYDNGGRTADRYAILPPRWASEYREPQHAARFLGIAASEAPFHPQGFGQTTIARPGPHLGKRVRWDALPPDVQTFARQMFPEYTPGAPPTRAPDINRLLRARPRSCTYGAPMGARDRDDAPEGARRYCQRVQFTDGDYGPDGTYWGGGRGVLPLYAVFTADLETLCYYRARDHRHALTQHRED